MSIRKSRPESGARRIRRAAEASRENILNAAEALLVDQGPLALKLAEVAAAARVANATVLHHFGSIDGLHVALMERMIDQLVANVLAAVAAHDKAEPPEAALQALFDAFETRGAARLAAWLELTGEWRRLTHVKDAVHKIVAQRAERGDVSEALAADMVLIRAALAMGVGLFGRSLAELIGLPPGRTRQLAAALLRAQAAASKPKGEA
ncbi:MAG: TetR family transcriptional regulator [Hydrogenophilaceae bacterium]|jgi:AcrR family transcriptional regulator|nr:TetR family transcriptional regulator [Hydrogenophilaceae bacterium]